MFVISSGRTKTISPHNQMEHIISESLWVENSLSYFFLMPFTGVKAWKMCVWERDLIREV